MRDKRLILVFVLIFALPQVSQAGMLTLAGIGGTNIHRRVVSMKVARFKHIVPQAMDMSCGAASLATLLQYYYKVDVSEQEIIKYILENGDLEKIKRGGFSFLDLKRYANKINYIANGYKLKDYQVLYKLRVPAIVLITGQGYQHFVVLKGIVGRKVFIADPLRGNIALSRSEFYDIWNGVIFIVLRADKRLGDSYLALETAIVDAPAAQIVRLGELGINNYNNMGMKNSVVFPTEF